MFLSVNLSGKQVLQRDIAREVGHVLKETGLDGRLLRLEMTETVIMDDADRTLSVLSDLKELNVGLDVDDFGIGYSSLRYLHRFPIDSLKIDRSFIENLHKRRESAEIVRTILALAPKHRRARSRRRRRDCRRVGRLEGYELRTRPGEPLCEAAQPRPNNPVDRKPPLLLVGAASATVWSGALSLGFPYIYGE